jgi:hypothetical protein
LLGALLPLLPFLRPATTGRANHAHRIAALALDDNLGPLLDPLKRCTTPVSCPSCRRGDPCPLDVWRLSLAEAVLRDVAAKQPRKLKPYTSFVAVGNSEGLEGGYMTMRVSGHPALADVTLRLVHRQWLAVEQRDKAATLARRAMAAGCTDPEIGEHHAVAIARAGTPEALAAGIDVCKMTLAQRRDSTDDAWDALAARVAQLGSRAARFRVRYEDNRDENGNLVVKRRHHAAGPLLRPPRFHPIG